MAGQVWHRRAAEVFAASYHSPQGRGLVKTGPDWTTVLLRHKNSGLNHFVTFKGEGDARRAEVLAKGHSFTIGKNGYLLMETPKPGLGLRGAVTPAQLSEIAKSVEQAHSILRRMK